MNVGPTETPTDAQKNGKFGDAIPEERNSLKPLKKKMPKRAVQVALLVQDHQEQPQTQFNRPLTVNLIELLDIIGHNPFLMLWDASILIIVIVL